jgi:hypothetical protein
VNGTYYRDTGYVSMNSVHVHTGFVKNVFDWFGENFRSLTQVSKKSPQGKILFHSIAQSKCRY